MPNEGSGNLTIGGHVSESVLITGSHNVIVLERAAAKAREAPRGRWGGRPLACAGPGAGVKLAPVAALLRLFRGGSHAPG